MDLSTIIRAIVCALIWFFLLFGMICMYNEFNEIKKDIAIIKAVLIMKNILPCELAKMEGEK
ncbi:hypothetical protein LRR18_16550, partial [Mangrovimonas sp. AS39]|uniref:hypothetical protein n=1 Tax=Mangrovimonas futianensis TaxID=2895523 RepID=UPI001E2F6200